MLDLRWVVGGCPWVKRKANGRAGNGNPSRLTLSEPHRPPPSVQTQLFENVTLLEKSVAAKGEPRFAAKVLRQVRVSPQTVLRSGKRDGTVTRSGTGRLVDPVARRLVTAND